jgi:tRNA (cytidine56-2'-O)-methyltransferase
MYGEPLAEKIPEIRRAAKKKGLLVVIGAEKVPREVYALCDYNVSVGNQPHSEVAALAVFLHELSEGRELNKKFANARITVTPNAR